MPILKKNQDQSKTQEQQKSQENQTSESPTVRLAITNDGMPLKEARYPKALNPPTQQSGPAGRLAIAAKQGGQSDLNVAGFGKAPSIRLAHVPGAQGDNNLIGQRGVKQLPAESSPALLVSYVYLGAFLKNQHRYQYRDWVMDSGAFSARNSGVEIDLQKYIDCCKELKAQDPSLTEIFALDVIGDWKTSLSNCEEMWRQGVEAIPCYHYADNDWSALLGIAKDYPKIAIGGMADLRGKEKRWYVEQCFARVWPKKMHGFGCAGEDMIMGFPWHSVDATNWEMGPCAFGRWMAFGGKLSVRGSNQNLRAEVEWYLELERKARERWKKEMKILEELPEVSPTVRLAISNDRKTSIEGRYLTGFGKEEGDSPLFE